jgi:L-lactate dehydrogenase complex protein LldG
MEEAGMNVVEFLAGRAALVPGPSPGLLVPTLERVDLVAMFGERLRSVAGVDHGPLPAAAAAELVVEVFRQEEVDEYLGWDNPGLSGIHQVLSRAGIRRRQGWVPREGPERVGFHRSLGEVGGGLTGADAGLAESGSIVLRSGPGRPRSASLLPGLHVAVLAVDRLVRSLAHYAAQHPAAPQGISNLVVVTGPSRSADIEQELTLGVHGPRQLHVILVN